MHSEPLFRILLGGLVLAAALLLTPLGVHVARADVTDDWTRSPLFSLSGVDTGDSASQCQPRRGPQRATSRSDAMARVMARVQAEIAAGGDPGIALNGQGYNYRTKADPWVQLERVQREARQLKR